MKDISIRMIRSNGFHPFKGSRGWKVIFPVILVAILFVLMSKKKPASPIPKKSSSAHQSVDARTLQDKADIEATPSEPDAELVNQVIALRKQGHSFVSIAREFDVDVKTVVKIVKQNNLN